MHPNQSQPHQLSERDAPKSFAGRVTRIWQWLTDPASTVQKPENRRRAQLLNSLLVILMPLPIIVSSIRLLVAPAYRPSLITMAGLTALPLIYGLSRTRYYKLAAVAITSLFPIQGCSVLKMLVNKGILW